MTTNNQRYHCPCCRYLTLTERANYEICPVCYWQDDGQDDPFADKISYDTNHGISLTQARTNYFLLGACSLDMLPHVRKPTQEERG